MQHVGELKYPKPLDLIVDAFICGDINIFNHCVKNHVMEPTYLIEADLSNAIRNEQLMLEMKKLNLIPPTVRSRGNKSVEYNDAWINDQFILVQSIEDNMQGSKDGSVLFAYFIRYNIDSTESAKKSITHSYPSSYSKRYLMEMFLDHIMRIWRKDMKKRWESKIYKKRAYDSFIGNWEDIGELYETIIKLLIKNIDMYRSECNANELVNRIICWIYHRKRELFQYLNNSSTRFNYRDTLTFFIYHELMSEKELGRLIGDCKDNAYWHYYNKCNNNC